MNRREFLGTAIAVTAASTLLAQNTTPEWGGSILDIHFHLRQGLDAEHDAHEWRRCDECCLAHTRRCRRTGQGDSGKISEEFCWSAGSDITKPEAEKILTKAVKDGAQGIGELKFHVEADGPELRRMYSLAAELNVPILVHFQEFPHFEGEGNWSTGFKGFAKILKEYPKTKFIGHADAFWANVSADYAEKEAYPSTPIVRGGITDKLLGDYPNLFGDLSANSGNNALVAQP